MYLSKYPGGWHCSTAVGLQRPYGTHLSPGCSTSHPDSCQCAWESSRDAQVFGLLHQMGDTGVSCNWPHAGTAPAGIDTWGRNQPKEDSLSTFLSLVSVSHSPPHPNLGTLTFKQINNYLRMNVFFSIEDGLIIISEHLFLVALFHKSL